MQDLSKEEQPKETVVSKGKVIDDWNGFYGKNMQKGDKCVLCGEKKPDLYLLGKAVCTTCARDIVHKALGR